MKKKNILIGTIASLVLTFVIADIFSIYHFKDIPTLITTLYLIAIFSLFEYISILIIYFFQKKKDKKKVTSKNLLGLLLLFIALILILSFLIIIDIDWLNWYASSAPFYINVIVRSLEFLLPALILITISVVLLREKKK